jgi:thiol-disulfide isomerase/thioredoxin
LATIASLGVIAEASDRKVIFEQHTASWCGPCQNTGLALAQLTDENPNTFQGIQMHIWNSSFGFDSTHCESRATFYGVSGIPHVEVDGVWEKSGTSGQAGDYTSFQSILNQRLNSPSSLGIAITGEPTGGSNYTVTMTLTADSNAPTRSMVVHCQMTLDADSGYPNASQGYYYDTHFDHMPTQTITLSAGQSQVMQHTFVLNSTAMNNTDLLTFSCFAQKPGSNGSANNLEIYNMNFMDYSLRAPETFSVGPNGQYQTIQAALTDSINGDTLLVQAGTYNESLDFDGASCTLISESGPESTIISAGNNGAVLNMLNSGSSTIDGFTLRDGSSSVGSAAKINGSPTIQNCIIRDNTSTSDFVIFGTGNPTIKNNVFCGNSHDNIGIIWIDGGGNTFEDICTDEPCPGDLDGDSSIGVNDVLALIGAWGTIEGDVDGNGTTDVNDLLEVIGLFGNSC